MKAVLIIPDGVGARTFLTPRFLSALSADTKILHVLPPEILGQYTGGDNGAHWERLLPSRDTALSLTLRQALGYAHMFWADTQGMRHNRRRPLKGSWRTRAVHRSARMIGRMSASPSRIAILDRYHCREMRNTPEVAHYRRLFQEWKPEVVFCSHQRPPSVIPAVLAAGSLGIPTATFIFSWDNLTSKSRIAVPFDHYLVWSSLMREDLLRYYPDVSPDRVHVVGTPQFDAYADASLLQSRPDFFASIGADPARPLICFSGGDVSIYQPEPMHADALLDFIRRKRIPGNPQVLVRPSPADDGRRYGPLRERYPEVLYARPAWVHGQPGNWSQAIPMPEDLTFLANLTHHADLNVNLASTMTLDFAIHDKPIVNTAFDVIDPPPLGRPLWDHYYQYEHYQPVLNLGAVRAARTRDDFADYVSAYLADPRLDREGRRRLVELQVGQPVGQSSQCVVDTLQQIAGA